MRLPPPAFFLATLGEAGKKLALEVVDGEAAEGAAAVGALAVRGEELGALSGEGVGGGAVGGGGAEGGSVVVVGSHLVAGDVLLEHVGHLPEAAEEEEGSGLELQRCLQARGEGEGGVEEGHGGGDIGWLLRRNEGSGVSDVLVDDLRKSSRVEKEKKRLDFNSCRPRKTKKNP